MKFEEVLPLIKEGKKALRTGWNGRGMFVVRQKGLGSDWPISSVDCYCYI